MPITSRCRNADGSSIAQTQKLRRNVSAGLSAMSFHVPYIASYLRTCSSRSSRPGDPADATLGEADLEVGEAHGDARVEPVDGGEHRVPEEQHADGVGRRVGRGRRRRARRADVQAHDGAGLLARAPSAGPSARCAATGSPSRCGASENVIALNPRSALRRTSSAPISGSRRYGICSGIMRPGAYARPVLDHPVVPRAHARRARARDRR